MERERSFPERAWPRVIFNFFKMTRSHGGKRAGAGRPKGRISPPEVLAANRAKRQVEELTREAAAKTALQYVAEAFETLSVVMRTAQSEQAKIAAAKEILDRALGKAREAPLEIIEDITPNHLSGGQHRPVLDLEDFRRVDR
jgi:hypothetical protein